MTNRVTFAPMLTVWRYELKERASQTDARGMSDAELEESNIRTIGEAIEVNVGISEYKIRSDVSVLQEIAELACVTETDIEVTNEELTNNELTEDRDVSLENEVIDEAATELAEVNKEPPLTLSERDHKSLSKIADQHQRDSTNKSQPDAFDRLGKLVLWCRDNKIVAWVKVVVDVFAKAPAP